MTTILFVVLDTASHLNASFKMAHAFKSRNHQIVYLGKPSSEKKIKQQGFDFLVRSENFQPEIIAGKVENTEDVKAIMEDNFLKMNLFDQAISQIKPGLVLLDTSLTYYTLHLLHRNIPIITVSTKVCQDKTEFIPPFLPIVFTFHNGIPEGIVENETGFLVPERDIDALSEKIRSLLKNEQLRTEMGKKGRDLVLERFDNRKLVEELSE